MKVKCRNSRSGALLRSSPQTSFSREGIRDLVMTIFKLVLLTLLRLVFFGVIKVALVVYILFLPDSPVAGIVQEGDGHTGDTAVNAAQEAGAPVASLTRDAFSSESSLEFERA
jgi:hypothetical protein